MSDITVVVQPPPQITVEISPQNTIVVEVGHQGPPGAGSLPPGIRGLTEDEYNWLYGQMPAHARPFPATLSKLTNTGDNDVPDYQCLLTLTGGIGIPDPPILNIDNDFVNGDVVRVLNVDNVWCILKYPDPSLAFYGVDGEPIYCADEAEVIAIFGSYPKRKLFANDTGCCYLVIGGTAADYFEFSFSTDGPGFYVYNQNFLSWMRGQISVSKIDLASVGATGTFTTSDGKTITVLDGLIRLIE